MLLRRCRTTSKKPNGSGNCRNSGGDINVSREDPLFDSDEEPLFETSLSPLLCLNSSLAMLASISIMHYLLVNLRTNTEFKSSLRSTHPIRLSQTSNLVKNSISSYYSSPNCE